ncbi:MAG: glycosyltransferase family 2 protein [Burkholderiaceae bacterium]
MLTVFWLALLFVIYTYVGYPLVVWGLARARGPEPPVSDELTEWPALTVVIAVHNEQARVLAKVENLRRANYPADRLQWLFVSDGSTDSTDELLRAIPDVRLIGYPQRQGKPHALNTALREVTTPVVVFADVRQHIEPAALRKLVARLLEPGIGAVSGELVHVRPGTHAAANIGLYWRYEKWIRKSESRLGSTVGATGALYAMRTADYTPLASDTILDDFEQPMLVARSGKRVVFEPGAVILDELQSDMAGERKRKIRTLTGNFQSFSRHPWMFVPWRNPLWLQFISHKVFRLLVPYALLLMLISSVFLPSAWAALFVSAQLLFYTLAALGHRVKKFSRLKLVSFAGVFVEMNWAAVVALRNWLVGGVNARWEKT